MINFRKKPLLKNKKVAVKRVTIEATHVFLTIPHFDELEQVYAKLESTSKEHLIKHFAVVLEEHTQDVNKGSHLHVFVSFKKKRDLSLGFFDFLGKHGNLQKVRSVEAVLQYMTKENTCKTNFDVWLTLLESSFTRTIIKMQEHGWNQDDILLAYASKVSGNKPWSTAFNLAVRHDMARTDKANKQELTRLRVITRDLIAARLSKIELQTFDADPQFQQLVDYINNMLKYGNQHPYKECCLSIVGSPSIGKSTVIRALQKHFITYNFPLDGWHSKYTNGVNELIVWNEWDIRLISRSDLLLFTEGEIVDLKVKYTKAVKKDRPLILLTSNERYLKQVRRKFNYDPDQRQVVSAALAVRIVELDFKDTPIWFLTKLFVAVTEDI